MKIDDIDAFVAVVRLQSLNQAADSLQLTQSAVTRRLQNFEETLGVALLDRNTKPLKPTAIGLRVYERCRVVLRELDSLRDLVAQDAMPSGALRLGVPQTIGDSALLEALQALRGSYPELQVQVSNGWGASLVKKLENDELDAAAALFPAGKQFPEGIVGRSLARMGLVIVAARGSAPKRSYRLAEQGLNLKVNLEIFGTDLQLSLVANGMGLGLVPLPLLQDSHHRDALDVLNVVDFKPMIDLWLLHAAFLGNLQGAVERFGESVAQRLATPADAAGASSPPQP